MSREKVIFDPVHIGVNCEKWVKDTIDAYADTFPGQNRQAQYRKGLEDFARSLPTFKGGRNEKKKGGTG